jgi:uncharacterized membrane protein YsdA (DUF1294 family)
LTRRYRYQTLFGGLAGAALVALFLALWFATDWPWYYSWPIAATAVAFIFYGADKALAKTNAKRVPEVVLHLLALAGGFVGALVGMFAFRHKSNFRAHPLFLPIIFISAGLWGFIIYRMMNGA